MRYLKIISLIAVMLQPAFSIAENDVPEFMEFCGMKLQLDQEARTYIQEVIYKLKKNPDRFDLLIERADTYMPFVEDAFSLAGLPSDLKYIVIQESALQGDAVSTSNAVGFWQFKDFTAKEVGLEINEFIDERKHIFRSSVGAALYFNRLHNDFGNWIYAITGYNQGPTGALPFIETKYLGTNEMVITLKVHWYALKAIAHKLAFQDVIGKNPEPKIWLEPKSNFGETSIDKLAQQHETEKENLLQYNLWIRGAQLPSSRWFTYYVPHENIPPLASLSDPNKELSFENRNATVADTQISIGGSDPNPQIIPEIQDQNIEASANLILHSTASGDTTFGSNYEIRSLLEDPEFGSVFVFVRDGSTLMQTALRLSVSTYMILEWNGIDPAKPVKPGAILFLQPLEKRLWHITSKGETLSMIAEFYDKKESKLSRLNGNTDPYEVLPEGQKIYLKFHRSDGEKIIILKSPEIHSQKKKETALKVTTPTVNNDTIGKSIKNLQSTPDYRLPEFESRMKMHTVETGETLWSISKKYNTTVDLIRKMNTLASDIIFKGQQLKVMERIPKP